MSGRRGETGGAAAAPKLRRAALFLPSLEGGGAERGFVTLAPALSRRGVAVDFVLARAEGPFLRLVSPQQRVVDLGARMTATSLPGLLGYLKNERPDVLMASMHAIVVALAAKKFFQPEVRVLAHYASTFSEEFRRVAPKGRAMMRTLRRLLPAADVVAAHSRGAAEDLAGQVPAVRSRVRVLHPPVAGPAEAGSGPPPRHPWFEELGPPVVVSVGRLDAGKDHETLIRAFAELRRRRHARLLVLGEGPLRGALESMGRELRIADWVDFPGFVARPLAYVARASVLAHSSRFEAFPLALVEALACGTPVVSADCPHGPAELLEQGKWGRLVPMGDWRAMAAALLATIEAPPPRAALVERAKAFSADALADRYLDAMFPAPETRPPHR